MVLVATTTASLAVFLCMNLLSRMSSGLGADNWYSCSVGMPLCEVQVDLAVFTLQRHIGGGDREEHLSKMLP